MGNLELLENAFDLAERGKVSNVTELCEKLAQRGASSAQLDQFRCRALGDQLRKRIAKSKRDIPSGK